MHNGLLKMGNAKMAGSVGNVINVVDLLKRIHPETVRFLLLGTHYRSPIEYSDDRLERSPPQSGRVLSLLRGYQRITGAAFYQIEGARSDRGEFEADGDW